jgi:hypothetical protein
MCGIAIRGMRSRASLGKSSPFAPHVLQICRGLRGYTLGAGMQTPHHVSVDHFVAEKALFLLAACLEVGDKDLTCARCGTQIKWEVASISTHCTAYQCLGIGIICQVDIPYCPECEEPPYVKGCFHVPEGHNVAAQLMS